MQSGSELCAIDHESVLHVPFERSLVGLVDLVRRDHFNVARDAILSAVIEHLLGLVNASNQGAHDLAVPENQGERAEVQRLGGGAHQNQSPLWLQAVQRSIDVMFGRNRVEDRIVPVRQFLELALRIGEDKLVSAEPLRIGLLPRGMAQHRDLGAERASEFHAHVAEAAEAHDGDPRALLQTDLSERRIRRDPCTKQGSRSGWVQSLGEVQDEMLVNDDLVGVAAKGRCLSVRVHAPVGHREAVLAVVFVAARAAAAGAARIDEAADADPLAFPESLGVLSGLHDPADDLVTRNAGEHGHPPFVPRTVDVGVADAAKINFYVNVAVAGSPAFELEWGKGFVGRLGRVSSGLHGFLRC